MSLIISLGIGTPSDIASFILVGLSPEAAPGSGTAYYFIPQGIGTPGDIAHFIHVGLSPTDVVVATPTWPLVSPTLELLLGVVPGGPWYVGDPETWVDLTDDLVNEPLRWSRGIFGAGPIDLLGRPGTLTWALDNTDTNSATTPYLYSPGHVNCLTGFKHGSIVRLKLTDGTNTRYVFRGRIRMIDPDPDLYGLQMARCMATDWLADFATYDAGQLFLRQAVRSDELLQDLIDSVPTQPRHSDIDMGLDEYEFAFDDLGGDMPKATEVAQDITQSERGYLYMRGDTSAGETLRFENRQARAAAEPLAVFGPENLLHDRQTIVVPSDLSHIFNDVEVLTIPRRVDTTPVILVQLDSPIEVTPGQTDQVFVDYQDPLNEAEKVGGVDMIQPLANTDWTANDARDGTGVDLTASCVVTAVYWGSRCMIEFTNNHQTLPAFVRGPGSEDGLQARGFGLYRYRPVSSRSTNQDSVDQYGARQLPSPLFMPYQEDRNVGQGVADYIAFLYGGLVKVPLQVTLDTFSSPTAVAQGILRDVGDPIELSEVATGVDEALVFIHGLTQELGVDGLLRTTWALCPGDASDVFILDDPDRGVLDQSLLAYA